MEFSVSYESVTLTTLQSHLEAGVPYLAFVRTGDLPYWNEDTAHELVAIGIGESSIYVNDAAFDEAPQTFPLDYFMLAWSEFDHRCAVIHRQE
jgi:hypothetical protein